MANSRPKLLDLIKLENSWFQVFAVGARNRYVVKNLDSGALKRLRLGEYLLVEKFEDCVGDLKKSSPERFIDLNIEFVHYGPEQNNFPMLKSLVNVFGIYVRKNG